MYCWVVGRVVNESGCSDKLMQGIPSSVQSDISSTSVVATEYAHDHCTQPSLGIVIG
jgi:hypothetical protein